jgi:small subunit ribosomal protein S3
MSAGALGVEVTISGKLRTERAHFEKHTLGVVPKSGDVAGKVVHLGITHVLTKMGLMGIQLRIASKADVPQEFEFKDSLAPNMQAQSSTSNSQIEETPVIQESPATPVEVSAESGNKGVESDGQA